MKKSILPAAFAAAALLLSSCGSVSEPKFSREIFCMDTYCTLTAYGDNAEESLKKAAELLEQLDDLWSVNKETSDIYKANHSDGKAVDADVRTEGLINYGQIRSLMTDGALDFSLYPISRLWGFTTDSFRVPDKSEIEELLHFVDCGQITAEDGKLTVPKGMMIDLGSMAKGYAGMEAAELLETEGIKSAILDLGGNIQTLGLKPDGSEWSIGIRDPEKDGLIGTVSVEDKAVVTSGGYERYFEQDGKRYHHILDPQTGYPAENGFASVTVIGDDGLNCDALSTALFVMGPDKAYEYWKREGGFDYIAVTDQGELILTKPIADSFKLDSGHSGVKMTFVE